MFVVARYPRYRNTKNWLIENGKFISMILVGYRQFFLDIVSHSLQ